VNWVEWNTSASRQMAKPLYNYRSLQVMIKFVRGQCTVWGTLPAATAHEVVPLSAELFAPWT
jgi:hypothetical protein